MSKDVCVDSSEQLAAHEGQLSARVSDNKYYSMCRIITPDQPISTGGLRSKTNILGLPDIEDIVSDHCKSYIIGSQI